MNRRGKKVEYLDQIVGEFMGSFFRANPITSWLGVIAIVALVVSIFSQLGGH